MSRAQAQRLGISVRFRNLDEVLVESDTSGDDASFIWSAGASTSSRTLSSLYPHQYSVFKADNNDDNDERHNQTDEGPDLSHLVKQNSHKINILETG